jgi:hypothetical protein
MDIVKIGRGLDLSEDRKPWRAFVNTVMNKRNSLTIQEEPLCVCGGG